MNRLNQPSDYLQAVRHIAEQDLDPQVSSIDAKGVYPEAILRALGAAGAYSQHVSLIRQDSGSSVWGAIAGMEAIGKICLSTAFCMWCQNALAWYIGASENAALKADLGKKVANGSVMGGTALSNPMKHFFGIEPIRLKGQPCSGGYIVSGSLPWVSNLGVDHHFAAVFERNDSPGHYVMAVVACHAPGVQLGEGASFLALNGTRTFSIRMNHVFVPHASVLADPIGPYLKRIRSGFILLQTGMALGLISSLIDLMQQMRETHEHINVFLPDQPEDIAVSLQSMRQTIVTLAGTPFESDAGYFREVIRTRLMASELSLRAAHAAMLHQGARGYLSTGLAQRRLREAYFVALVTPAIKQLRKMLHDLGDG